LSDPRPGPGEDLPVPIDLPADAVPDDGASDGVSVPPSSVRPSPFTLDGRAAPGLYLVGWLGTLIGLGASFVGISGGAGPLFLIGLVILTLGLLAGAGRPGARAEPVDRPGVSGTVALARVRRDDRALAGCPGPGRHRRPCLGDLDDAAAPDDDPARGDGAGVRGGRPAAQSSGPARSPGPTWACGSRPRGS
jgi:hypothetical protein